MKNPLLLLALAAAAAGGCQQASQSGPNFVPGMSRVNLSVGFSSLEADGPAYVASDGGVPTLVDNQLADITVTEMDAATLSGSYGLILSPNFEVGTRFGVGAASADYLTVTDTDYDGDGFNDRANAGGVAADEDLTYAQIGGYSRWYPTRWGAFSPWLQFDFGYYLSDISGLYYGGSLGMSWFINQGSAIEARVYGETISDDDDITCAGIEIGYSIFQ